MFVYVCDFLPVRISIANTRLSMHLTCMEVVPEHAGVQISHMHTYTYTTTLTLIHAEMCH